MNETWSPDVNQICSRQCAKYSCASCHSAFQFSSQWQSRTPAKIAVQRLHRSVGTATRRGLGGVLLPINHSKQCDRGQTDSLAAIRRRAASSGPGVRLTPWRTPGPLRKSTPRDTAGAPRPMEPLRSSSPVPAITTLSVRLRGSGQLHHTGNSNRPVQVLVLSLS
jgi:hypothetical protein